MASRTSSTALKQARIAREIVAPLVPEIGSINEEAAKIEALANRLQPSEEDTRGLSLRANAARTSLQRVEEQLAVALRGQPTEIAEQGRVRDVRAAISAVRTRLARLPP